MYKGYEQIQKQKNKVNKHMKKKKREREAWKSMGLQRVVHDLMTEQ